MERKILNYLSKGQEIFIGLEDSKRSWKVCVRCNHSIIHETSMPARFEVLQKYLKRFVECKIMLMYEAGFKGYNLHDQLVAEGIDCVVLPPHQLQEAKVSRVKTDKRDARKIAYTLESGNFHRCRVPTPQRREDRQIVRTLNAVEKEIKATRNRIRKLLDFHGIPLSIDKKAWNKGDFRQLRSISFGASLQMSIGVYLDILEMLWGQQTKLRLELRNLSKQQPYAQSVSIIQSFPGIGWLSAIRFVLELGEDLGTFNSGKAVAAYIGLTGREYSTGESVRRGSITGMGNSWVRSWLVECAWTALRYDAALQEFYQRMVSNTGCGKKPIVAVARKMAVRIYACVKLQTPYVVGVVQ